VTCDTTGSTGENDLEKKMHLNAQAGPTQKNLLKYMCAQKTGWNMIRLRERARERKGSDY
jgi:hypothetical protein